MLTPPRLPPMMGPRGTESLFLVSVSASLVADERGGEVGISLVLVIADVVAGAVIVGACDKLVVTDTKNGDCAKIVSRALNRAQPTWV